MRWAKSIRVAFQGSNTSENTVKKNIEENKYILTKQTYRETEDLLLAVKKEYGPKAEIADWSELKQILGADSEQMDALILLLGLKKHDGNKPSSYLSHDEIQNNILSLDNILSLGPWSGYKLRILVKLN